MQAAAASGFPSSPGLKGSPEMVVDFSPQNLSFPTLVLRSTYKGLTESHRATLKLL